MIEERSVGLILVKDDLVITILRKVVKRRSRL